MPLYLAEILLTIFSFSMFIFVVLLGITFVYGLISGVPWVPSRSDTIRQMLDLAGVKKGDKFADLGCGDGRMLFMAEKLGARVYGYELALLAFLAAKLRKFFLGSNARIEFKSFFEINLEKFDVVALYLMPETLEKLKPKLEKELKKGSRIVSHAFQIKGWKPIKKISRDSKNKANIFLYQIN